MFLLPDALVLLDFYLFFFGLVFLIVPSSPAHPQ